jgi:hypothetical protein
MENNMPDANSFSSMKAAFEAAFPPDPDAEISFKNGCIRIGFYRQNFLSALKRQQAADAVGEIIVGPRLPEPHWKDDSQWFYLREVEACIASKQGE